MTSDIHSISNHLFKLFKIHDIQNPFEGSIFFCNAPTILIALLEDVDDGVTGFVREDLPTGGILRQNKPKSDVAVRLTYNNSSDWIEPTLVSPTGCKIRVLLATFPDH